ncbi:MAG: hypothetical protein JO189_05475 [Deltaproteobacteria bacterium]|nr:hypothetical protein [Deltaproteobacteria bacterium]
MESAQHVLLGAASEHRQFAHRFRMILRDQTQESAVFGGEQFGISFEGAKLDFTGAGINVSGFDSDFRLVGVHLALAVDHVEREFLELLIGSLPVLTHDAESFLKVLRH